VKDNRLNPGSVILEQIDGQYEKFLLLILKKYLPQGAVITQADIQALLDTPPGEGFVLFSHGHRDSIEFKAIKEKDAARLVEHDERTNKGRA
jgi:hypothetical protein